MSFAISDIKNNLIGMGHGSTLNKVRNIEVMFERAAAKFLLKCHPLEAMRTAALSNVVHDDVFNYTLPTDFGSIIDLIPQDNRQTWDTALRNNAGVFDLEKAIKTRVVSIEGSEGIKIIRINWRTRKGKVLNAMDSVTANGTWGAVGTASGITADTIFKKTGNASIKFQIAASGDGIKNTTMTAQDFTLENGVADNFVWVFLDSDYAKLTSITAVWGNDVTTKYWTSAAITTQADGTAFKNGWNLIKASWSAASQTGTVAPATINSYKITFTTTGAMVNVRVDSVIFSIGRNFDLKYYSKYLFRNSAGTFISRTTSDNDSVNVDNDTLPHYLYECLSEMAQQMQGSDGSFDIGYARQELMALYPAYTGMYPSQLKKVVTGYGNRDPFRSSQNRRW